MQSKNITGRDAALALHDANIVVNKNLIPFDPQGAQLTSGLRLGTPSVTTRGMKEDQKPREIKWERVLYTMKNRRLSRIVIRKI